MNEKQDYQKAQYLTSAAELKQLPQDKGWEVAFIGRSNAGKSSALNAITGIKGLARTSSTPGRTQMINLFNLDDDRRLVDLPGYGYAKVPRTVQERWIENTNEYLKTRDCLKGLVVVMDVRHPLKDSDIQLIEWTTACELSIHILLTKSDKLNNSEQKNTLMKVQKELKQFGDKISVQLFSSIKKIGIDEARGLLNEWFE
ncbi:MAG: ribosome biogenesis GTP-binding protein YihA/YsxC [Gammaproteobacteria bacterium]|nr:ribosome biogenesis GTP-binding protein YihA/YsxC [Gammaproteobacteria bacterium]MCH9744368.1 ribosome biogenesis GTP-binding protein YihA/YsxC [Gammaproteobacteria bacterium]